MEISKEVYSIVDQFPDVEKYVLQVQLCKCAISIPSNIAEGCAKSSAKDFKRYLKISLGSAYELETQLILATDIYKVDATDLMQKLQEMEKMLAVFINKLR